MGGRIPLLRTMAIDIHSRVDEGVIVGNAESTVHFLDNLVLLVSSQQAFQHALDWFIAVYGQAGMKNSTKNIEALCPLQAKARVYAASERQCTTADGGVQMLRGGIFD